jgi:DNA repair protein RadA/Sms
VAAGPVAITDVDPGSERRLTLAWNELNRALGGGLVRGSLVLLGGEPGVGKSTLLMHLAAQAAAAGRVLYTSGEESAQQVGMRARRLGLLDPNLLVLAETELDAVVAAIEAALPAIAVVDSIQTMHDSEVEGAPGSVSQVRASAARLLRLAKQTGVPVLLIGHVTKEGAIAGPRVLEHMVDTVLYLEGEHGQELRVLRPVKNRFGSTEEIGIFQMGEAGLVEVSDPSAFLIGDRRPVPGTSVMAALEGSRPLLVEVQSLVTGTSFGLPRRSANGFDLNRLHLLVAVLEKRAGLALGNHDVYVNVAGGLRVMEPAADLPVALTIAGNLADQAVRPDTVVVGELGLSGEVRRVGGLERRLQEAARRGFTRAMVPAATINAPPGLELVQVRDLGQALAVTFPEWNPRAWSARQASDRSRSQQEEKAWT